MTRSEFKNFNIIQNPAAMYNGVECPVVNVDKENEHFYIRTRDINRMVHFTEIELIKK
jgi:hypothetical protein